MGGWVDVERSWAFKGLEVPSLVQRFPGFFHRLKRVNHHFLK